MGPLLGSLIPFAPQVRTREDNFFSLPPFVIIRVPQTATGIGMLRATSSSCPDPVGYKRERRCLFPTCVSSRLHYLVTIGGSCWQRVGSSFAYVFVVQLSWLYQRAWLA